MPTLPLPTPEQFVIQFMRWRRQKGYSQQVAARLLPIHHMTIALWELGKRRPSERTMKKVLPLLEGILR